MMLMLLFTLATEPVQEIKLDNKGIYLSKTSYGQVHMALDGTFLVSSQYHLWHWNQDGSLINRIGGKGEGPGEFMGAGQTLWNGEHYWIIDSQRLLSSIFDHNGRYLSRKSVYYRQFVHVDGQLFVVDPSRYDSFNPNYPPILQEIRYQIKNGELSVEHTDLLFRKISRQQNELMLNFKLLWAVREGKDRYLVVDQLEPKMGIYDPQARVREKKLPMRSVFEPKFIPMRLKYWVDPPRAFIKNVTIRNEFLRWWQSWSRINYFGRAGEDYVVAYEIPDPKNLESSLQAVQRVAKTGHALGDMLILEGFCMGSRDDKLYVFFEGEASKKFEYFIRVYEL